MLKSVHFFRRKGFFVYLFVVQLSFEVKNLNLSILKDTHQNSEGEEKLNQKTEEITDRQEYEFIDQEITELTQEREQ